MVRARYYNIHRHAYSDTAEQHVSGDTMHQLTLATGLKVQKEFDICGGEFVPDTSLHFTYDAISDKDHSVVNLANGASYNVYGNRLKRFGTEVETGAKVEIDDSFSVRLSYLGRYRQNYQNHTGMLDLKYNF